MRETFHFPADSPVPLMELLRAHDDYLRWHSWRRRCSWALVLLAIASALVWRLRVLPRLHAAAPFLLWALGAALALFGTLALGEHRRRRARDRLAAEPPR
jgi:hypothetical protein